MVALEVTSDSSVATCVQHVMEQAGRIDVLVNNVGDGIFGAAEELSVAEAKDLFDINFFGAVRMTSAVLPIMRAQQAGRVISMSSPGGMAGIPFNSVYCASKFALEGYLESVRYEVAPFGISVAIVAPAAVRTPAAARAATAARHLDAYAAVRERVMCDFVDTMAAGLDPEVVAKAIARILRTDRRTKPRYTVGQRAASISLIRRVLPQRLFEQVVRRIFKLNGQAR